MKFKQSYFVIPALIFLLTAFNAYFMGAFESAGLTTTFALFIGILALVAILKAVPVVLFWNQFPRRERCFYPILALFVIAELIIIADIFSAYYPMPDYLFMILSLAPAVIYFIIAIVLWMHGLRLAAAWIIALFLLGFASIALQRMESKMESKYVGYHEVAPVYRIVTRGSKQ